MRIDKTGGIVYVLPLLDACQAIYRDATRLARSRRKAKKMGKIQGLVNLQHCGIFATTEAALQQLFETVDGLGYPVKRLKRTGHDPLHPQWRIEPKPDVSASSSRDVYEAWHWAPLRPAPRLHETMLTMIGMPYDCGMYLQDDTPGIHDVHLLRLRFIVEGLTTLDVEVWDRLVKQTPKSGPEFIRAMAAFCHPEAIVTDAPNEGNLFCAFGRALSGQKPSRRELEAAGDAWNSRSKSPALRKLVGSR